jgi:hypothetical protein
MKCNAGSISSIPPFRHYLANQVLRIIATFRPKCEVVRAVFVVRVASVRFLFPGYDLSTFFSLLQAIESVVYRPVVLIGTWRPTPSVVASGFMSLNREAGGL